MAPQQTPNQPKVHVYTSFLVSRLHNEEAEVGNYNFKAVRNNDNRNDGGLTALDELYIPTNIDNTHWNSIQAVMHTKSIRLFDSQGKKEDNHRFLKAVKKYMSNALSENAEGER